MADYINDGLDAMRDLFASFASFQSWVGAVDATAAKARICRVAASPGFKTSTAGVLDPYLRLGIPGPRLRMHSNDPGFVTGLAFPIELVSGIATANHSDAAAAMTAYLASVGPIMQAIIESSGTVFVIRDLEYEDSVMRGHRDDEAEDGPMLVWQVNVITGVEE